MTMVCITHHFACDCREQRAQRIEAAAMALWDKCSDKQLLAEKLELGAALDTQSFAFSAHDGLGGGA